jgi:uncharacterized repeat protein (TIGR01451 family)
MAAGWAGEFGNARLTVSSSGDDPTWWNYDLSGLLLLSCGDDAGDEKHFLPLNFLPGRNREFPPHRPGRKSRSAPIAARLALGNVLAPTRKIMKAFPGLQFRLSAFGIGLKTVGALAAMFLVPSAFAWPDLRVVKAGPREAAPGEVITYTLNYTNVGPVKSTGVVLKDFLPPNVTVVSGTLAGGTLSGSTISWSIGSLASKAKGSRSFQVRVGSNLLSGTTITNKAQIFGSESEEPGKTVDNYSKLITTIVGGNNAPMAQADFYTGAEDAVLAVPSPGVLGNDSDQDGDSLTAQLVALPSHGTLTLNANGSFSYAPTPNYHGPDAFTYRANDGTTNSGLVLVTIEVTPVNDAPVALSDSYLVAEDGNLNVLAPGVLGNDSDLDGDVLTAVLNAGPEHGALIFNSDGSFSYTPVPNYHGPDSFTYRANDGATNSGIVTVTLNVTPVNDAPAAQPDAYTLAEGGTLNLPGPGVLGNDSDGDGDALTAILVAGPAHGTLTLNSDGGFSYAPDPKYNGPDSFTYRANDGATNSGIVTVTLDVTPVNDPPVAISDSYTVAEDGDLNGPAPGVLGNDSDLDGDALTALLVTGPEHGTLTLNSDGSFSYAPAPNFSGLDSFAYRANDGTTNSEIAPVMVNVTPRNDAPGALDDSYATLKNLTLTVLAPGVLSNDTDVDADPLSAFLVGAPVHGQLTLSSNGSFQYVPSSNYAGADFFTYRAADGQTTSAIATVTITVVETNRPPDPTNWTGSQFTAHEDVRLEVAAPGVLAGIVDWDGNALAVIPMGGTTHGQLNLSTDGSFTYLAETNFFGPDSFQFLVSDGETNSGLLTAIITVLPVNDAPTFVNGGNLRIQQNAGAQMVSGWATQISGGPANESEQTVAFEVTNPNPALFAMAPAISPDGTLTYTPAVNRNGTVIVTVTARDSGGTANGGANASPPQTFALTINAPPTVQIVSPTNGAFFFVPADFTVLAEAHDADGSVAQVEFFAATNSIGVATNAPFFAVLTNLPAGSYPLTAVATDDFGATNAAAPVTVNVLERPPLTLLSSVYYNPQTDYFEQRVLVNNPTYSTLNAVRVMVHNLTNVPAITVGNASGYSNGVPYVATYAPVPPGSHVDLVIEFISPLRVKPNPVLAAQLVPAPGNPASGPGMFQRINRGRFLANRTFFVEFATQSNRVYAIQYSDDLQLWKNAQPVIQGDGNWVQWIDNGLPKTERPPAQAPVRFYRLMQLP